MCRCKCDGETAVFLVEAGTWPLRDAKRSLLAERRWDPDHAADPGPVSSLDQATVTAVEVADGGQLRVELSSGEVLTVAGDADAAPIPHPARTLQPCHSGL